MHLPLRNENINNNLHKDCIQMLDAALFIKVQTLKWSKTFVDGWVDKQTTVDPESRLPLAGREKTFPIPNNMDES